MKNLYVTLHLSTGKDRCLKTNNFMSCDDFLESYDRYEYLRFTDEQGIHTYYKHHIVGVSVRELKERKENERINKTFGIANVSWKRCSSRV